MKFLKYLNVELKSQGHMSENFANEEKSLSKKKFRRHLQAKDDKMI